VAGGARAGPRGFQKYHGVVAGDRARIAGLPAGRYLVTAHTAEEIDAATVVVADGAVAEVALTSHGTGRLVATVREFTTGTPVADMRCLVDPTAEGWSAAIRRGTTRWRRRPTRRARW
jgi:hypothetical protein